MRQMIDQSRDFFLWRYFPFSLKHSAGYQVCWFVLKLEKGEVKREKSASNGLKQASYSSSSSFYRHHYELNLPGCSKIQEAEGDSVEGERMTNNPTPLSSVSSVSILKIDDTRPLQLLHAILEQSMS